MAYSGLLCYDLSLLIWYNIYPHSKKKKLKKMFKKKGEGGRKKIQTNPQTPLFPHKEKHQILLKYAELSLVLLH